MQIIIFPIFSQNLIETKCIWYLYLIFKFLIFPETDLIWQNLHRFEFAKTANIRQNVNLEFFIPQIVFLLQLYLPSIKKSIKGHYLHIWLCSKHDHYIHHLYLSKAKLHKNINVYKLQLMNRHIHSCYICEKMFIYLFILAFWIFISIGTNNIHLAFIDDY